MFFKTRDTRADDCFALLGIKESFPCLTDRGFLGLLGSVFTPAAHSGRDTAQIQSSSNQMIPHTRTILGSAAAHEDDTVLLDVVALSGNIRGNDLAGGKSDTSDLTLT